MLTTLPSRQDGHGIWADGIGPNCEQSYGVWRKGLSDEVGDVAWKISSGFIRRLMIDDLSGLSQGVTALPHLCHRYLSPKGFVKKERKGKGRCPMISKGGRVINRGAFGRQKWLSKRAKYFCTCPCVCQGMSTKPKSKHYAWVK